MTDEEKKKEERRKYQAKYYRAHREKALAYQKIYNLNHKKKRGGGWNRKSNPVWQRRAKTTSINYSDFQRLDLSHFEQACGAILKGSLKLVTLKRGEK